MSENSSDLEKKLMTVLSNPEALSSIMSIAKGFTQSTEQQSPAIDDKIEEKQAVSVSAPAYSSNSSGKELISDKSIGLLLALKPFLSDNRCEKIDTITGLLKVALLTDLFK